MSEHAAYFRPEGFGGIEAAVAAACGFADQPHLTRTFRRAVGVTPARYARAVAG